MSFGVLQGLWNGAFQPFFISETHSTLFFAENKNHDDDTDDSDDDNIFGDEVAPVQNMPKQQTSSTSSQGRYRKYVKKSLQVFDIVDHIPTYY